MAFTDTIEVSCSRPIHRAALVAASALRYLRIYGRFTRICFARELMFRTNFLARLVTHILWLGVMLAFFEVIFRHTAAVGEWDRQRYLVFLGTLLTLNATVNALFMGNCVELSQLIRTGNLDFALLKPLDEQFLLTCLRIDWALVPQAAFGLGLAVYGAFQLESGAHPERLLIYLLLLILAVTVLYGMLVMLASISFWTVQHGGLLEIWFSLLQLGNYPDDIYRKHAAVVVTYLLPIVVAVNVPAKFGAMLLESWLPIAILGGAALAALAGSRFVFRTGLRHYRSAGG